MNPLLEKIRIYILILVAYFFFLFRKKQKETEDPKRILLIPQLTRVGDLICSTPVFRKIKEKYPESFLGVVVTPKTEAIVVNNPHIDEVIVLPDRDYLEFFGLFRFFKKIQSYGFDWVINLASSTLGTLVGVFGKIPNRVKIIKQPRPITELLTDWMNRHRIIYKPGERIALLYLKALASLGINLSSEDSKEVYISPSKEREMRRFWGEHQLEGKAPVIGISISAGNMKKTWSLKNFVRLAEAIKSEYGARIIFLGMPEHREQILNALRGADVGAVVATGFSLAALPSFIKRLDLFIASDSGPIHIADALSVPLVDIVGPVDPDEQTPRGEHAKVVCPPKGIRPTIFALRPVGNPSETRRALEETSVDAVLDAARSLLSN